MAGMKKVFDITDRGYRIRAYWGKPSDAKVTIHKGKELYKKFTYPAYKVFNLAAHFGDIVDGILDEQEKCGFAMAGHNGLGGVVMPKETTDAP